MHALMHVQINAIIMPCCKCNLKKWTLDTHILGNKGKFEQEKNNKVSSGWTS
jgi:hypothetical protein